MKNSLLYSTMMLVYFLSSPATSICGDLEFVRDSVEVSITGINGGFDGGPGNLDASLYDYDSDGIAAEADVGTTSLVNTGGINSAGAFGSWHIAEIIAQSGTTGPGAYAENIAYFLAEDTVTSASQNQTYSSPVKMDFDTYWSDSGIGVPLGYSVMQPVPPNREINFSMWVGNASIGIEASAGFNGGLPTAFIFDSSGQIGYAQGTDDINSVSGSFSVTFTYYEAVHGTSAGFEGTFQDGIGTGGYGAFADVHNIYNGEFDASFELLLLDP